LPAAFLLLHTNSSRIFKNNNISVTKILLYPDNCLPNLDGFSAAGGVEAATVLAKDCCFDGSISLTPP
jgi:hypothetical protein